MWNWQIKEWPNYSFDIKGITAFEQALLKGYGAFSAIFKYLDPNDQAQMKVQLLTEEAEKTSLIEGEFLNRDSLQASIRREMGLETPQLHTTPAEQGIAKMMLEAYKSFDAPLTHETLFLWHKLLSQGRKDLEFIGEYRAHEDPMLIVSRGKYEPIIHFQAPPSKDVQRLMTQFIEWFNDTSPQGNHPLPAVLRASIAHLYFETIHPFEDGNGRIGRAVAIKALSQTLGGPLLIALSYTIESNKKAYYAALQTTNRSLDIQTWIEYFADMLIRAQRHTQRHIEFLIQKAKFFNRYDQRLNERQRKVLLRMFREGVDGFKGGLSAENYIAITQTSRATATRDLQDLVEMGALTKTGERRYTRYFIAN